MQDEAGESLGLVPLRPFPVVPHRVAVEPVVEGRCGEPPQGLDVTDVVAALLAALRAVAGSAAATTFWPIAECTATLLILWLACWGLYRRRIFIRI